MKRWLWVVVVFGLVAISYKLRLWLFLSGRETLQDFDAYYQLSQAVYHGQNPYQVATMQTLGPPLVIAPFLLVSWLPLSVARAIMSWLNLICWMLSCGWLAKKYWPQQWMLTSLVLLGILLSSFPARFALALGQPHGVLTLLMTAVLLSSSRQVVGVAIGAAAVFKTYFVALLASYRPKPIIVWWAGVTIVLSVLLTLPFLTVTQYQTFLQSRFSNVVWQPNHANDVDYYNQSLKATLQRLQVSEWYSWLYPLLLAVTFMYLLISGSVVMGIVFSIGLSPVLWQHYMVILFPVIVSIWAHTTWWSRRRWLLLLASYLVWCELPWLHGQTITWWTGLLASHYFLGVVLIGICAVSLKLDSEV